MYSPSAFSLRISVHAHRMMQTTTFRVYVITQLIGRPLAVASGFLVLQAFHQKSVRKPAREIGASRECRRKLQLLY